MAPITRKFQKGEFIFREGYSGHCAYFVKRGAVEISVERDGQKVVIETVVPGNCFGELAPVLDRNRSATAVAREFTEAVVVDKETLDTLFQQTNPIVRTIVRSLMERARRNLDMLVVNGPATVCVEAVAQILDLKARAAQRRPGEAAALPLAECIESVEGITGVTRHQARKLLEQAVRMNLVELEGGGPRALLRVKPGEVVRAARNLSVNLGEALKDQLRSEAELIEIEDLAAMVGADKRAVYRKMASGELPESLFLFRKSEALSLIEEHGPEFFRRRRLKRVDELEGVDDIEFVDTDALAQALGEMEPYRVATLLKQQGPETRERALGAVSQRMRGIIEETMRMLGAVDDLEVAQLEAELIERIKVLKGGRPMPATR